MKSTKTQKKKKKIGKGAQTLGFFSFLFFIFFFILGAGSWRNIADLTSGQIIGVIQIILTKHTMITIIKEGPQRN